MSAWRFLATAPAGLPCSACGPLLVAGRAIPGIGLFHGFGVIAAHWVPSLRQIGLGWFLVAGLQRTADRGPALSPQVEMTAGPQ